MSPTQLTIFPLGQVTLSESEPVRTSPDLLVLVNCLTELGTDRHQPNWPFCPSGAKMTPNLIDMTSNIYRDYPGSWHHSGTMVNESGLIRFRYGADVENVEILSGS